MIPLFICVDGGPQEKPAGRRHISRAFSRAAPYTNLDCKKGGNEMRYRNDEPADCGDLDDWIFRDEEYEVSRR